MELNYINKVSLHPAIVTDNKTIGVLHINDIYNFVYAKYNYTDGSVGYKAEIYMEIFDGKSCIIKTDTENELKLSVYKFYLKEMDLMTKLVKEYDIKNN